MTEAEKTKNDILTEMRIVEINENEFQVPSSDGSKNYTVKYCGSGDADPDYISLWECNCPAGQHGKTCKHVKLVASANDKINDELGY